MTGTLVCFTVLAAGQPAPPQPPAETLVRFNVTPTPAPKPALRYLLLPDLREQTPGNPIPNYLKCFFDQDFSADEEVLGPAALRQADRAARMDKPDWQLQYHLRTDGINLLLPDLQKMRAIAQALQARFRDEVARGRFDDALYTARTMLALSRHTGGHPTIIGNLVGIAIGSVTVTPLEELIDRPGCPNLYWALAALPSPFIPLEPGLEGERLLTVAEFRDLSDADPLTPDQLREFIAHLDSILTVATGKKTGLTRAFLDVRVRDAGYVAGARARLVEYGLREHRVARFPADQVVLLDEKRKYETRRDDEFKLVHVPVWEAEAPLPPVQRGMVPGLFDGFLPSLYRIRRAQARLDQRLAMLRHVEALRLYAAGHDGKLPARLADVGVPLPPDPFTGKPFRYELDGETAHVRGTPPKGDEQNAAFNVHYEVAVRK